MTSRLCEYVPSIRLPPEVQYKTRNSSITKTLRDVLAAGIDRIDVARFAALTRYSAAQRQRRQLEERARLRCTSLATAQKG